METIHEAVAAQKATGLELITCIVQRGKADKVAKAALKAGASGATISFARGMGLRERLGLLGLAIVPEKEVITVVCEETTTAAIFAAVVAAAHLDVPGMGIAFVHSLSRVAGFFPAGNVDG
jgi:nitrogen regulatory protein P-II 1